MFKINTLPINNAGIYNLDFNYYLNYDFDSIFKYNKLLNDPLFTTFKMHYIEKTELNKTKYLALQKQIDVLIGDSKTDPYTFTFIESDSIENIKQLLKVIYINQNEIFQNFLHYCNYLLTFY